MTWITGKHNPLALWMFDEESGNTVANQGSAGGSFNVDAGMLGQILGGVPHRTGIDFGIAGRTTDGWFDTGLDLSMSTSDYTVLLLLNTIRPTSAGGEIFMAVTPDPTTTNSSRYWSLPYLPSGSNNDFAILDHNGVGGPTTRIIDNINEQGWMVLAITWEQATQTITPYLNGQPVDNSSSTWPQVASNWNLPGNSRVYVGGWRPPPGGSRRWNRRNGPLVIAAKLLSPSEVIEASVRMLSTSMPDYARATTP